MCDTNCACSSNQKSNKCNSKEYTSKLTYDGESIACSILSSIKKNCTSLNSLLQLFGSVICTLRSDVDTLMASAGFSFAFYQELASSYVWTNDADLLTGFTFTASGDGFYQVHVTCNTDMVPSASGNLFLYINGSPVTTMTVSLNSANAQHIGETSIVWRGQVLDGQDIEARVQSLSAFQLVTKTASILINKE
jgi:hypothetical protein